MRRKSTVSPWRVGYFCLEFRHEMKDSSCIEAGQVTSKPVEPLLESSHVNRRVILPSLFKIYCIKRYLLCAIHSGPQAPCNQKKELCLIKLKQAGSLNTLLMVHIKHCLLDKVSLKQNISFLLQTTDSITWMQMKWSYLSVMNQIG